MKPFSIWSVLSCTLSTTSLAATPLVEFEAADGTVTDLTEDIAASGTTPYPYTMTEDGTLRFSEGTWYVQLVVDAATVDITGIEGQEPPTLSGAGLERVLKVRSSSVVSVSGLRFADGYSETANGGAITVKDTSALDVSDCTFEDNAANNGGALAIRSGSTARVIGASFHNNAAVERGGAVQVFNGSSLYLADADLVDNSAEDGGAISVTSAAELVLATATLRGNTADTDGSGVYTSSTSELLVSNTTFADNDVSFGGSDTYTYGRYAAFECYSGACEDLTSVALKAHVIAEDDCSGANPIENVVSDVTLLNAYYNDFGVSFYLAGVAWDCSSANNNIESKAEVDGLATAISGLDGDVLNVIYAETLFRGSGVARPDDNFILLSNASSEATTDNPTDYPGNATAAHEAGHAFGLLHTFDTQHGAESVPRSGPYADCHTTGDLLCDTNADPDYSASDIDDSTQPCSYTGATTYDTHGFPYHSTVLQPPLDNLMSYAPHTCRAGFSEGQIDIITDNIANGGVPGTVTYDAAPGYLVCADGCAYGALEDAIDAAPDGATITLGLGTFIADNIATNKALTIAGQGVGDPTDCSGPTVLAGNNNGLFDVSGAGAITLEGLLIDKTGGGSASGVSWEADSVCTP